MFGRPKSGHFSAARPISAGTAKATHPKSCPCDEDLCRAQAAASKQLNEALDSVDESVKETETLQASAKKITLSLLRSPDSK